MKIDNNRINKEFINKDKPSMQDRIEALEDMLLAIVTEVQSNESNK